MLRLVVEYVTLVKGPQVAVHVRLKGGAARTMAAVTLPHAWSAMHRTPYVVVTAIRSLGSGWPNAETAHILNEKGHKTGGSKHFDAARVGYICRNHQLRDPLPAPSRTVPTGVAPEAG